MEDRKLMKRRTCSDDVCLEDLLEAEDRKLEVMRENRTLNFPALLAYEHRIALYRKLEGECRNIFISAIQTLRLTHLANFFERDEIQNAQRTIIRTIARLAYYPIYKKGEVPPEDQEKGNDALIIDSVVDEVYQEVMDRVMS